MRIAFDTNFLVDLLRFRIGFDALLDFGKEFYVSTQNLQELQKISRSKKKEAKFAKLALEWVEKNARVLRAEGSTDKILVELAKQGFLVATNDSKLRKEIKQLGFKTLYIRAKKKIYVD